MDRKPKPKRPRLLRNNPPTNPRRPNNPKEIQEQADSVNTHANVLLPSQHKTAES